MATGFLDKNVEFIETVSLCIQIQGKVPKVEVSTIHGI